MAAAAKPIYAAQAGTDCSIASLLINCPTRRCPLCSQKRTLAECVLMSALCQKQIHTDVDLKGARSRESWPVMEKAITGANNRSD